MLLTVKDKEVSSAVLPMTADFQMRMTDTEGFCDNIPGPNQRERVRGRERGRERKKDRNKIDR